jgi:hypothetical protein
LTHPLSHLGHPVHHLLQIRDCLERKGVRVRYQSDFIDRLLEGVELLLIGVGESNECFEPLVASDPEQNTSD